ncbi:MAG: rod shape-determining protein MreD [Clostridiales bacterium]|nr:rod shape-determining protein MreD [Clostridiales bacterium]
MKNKLYIILILVLSIALQMTLIEGIRIANVKPNIVLIFVLFLGVCATGSDLFFGGILAGVMQDLLSSKIIGMYLITNILFCMIMYTVRKRSYRKDFLIFLFVAFISFLLYDSTAYLLTSFPETLGELFFVLKNFILVGAMYNTACAILIFGLAKKKEII